MEIFFYYLTYFSMNFIFIFSPDGGRKEQKNYNSEKSEKNGNDDDNYDGSDEFSGAYSKKKELL